MHQLIYRRVSYSLLVSLLIILVSSFLYAEGTDLLPPIVISGLTAYKQKGASEAIKTWIKGGPLEENKEAMSQSNSLKQIESLFGSYEGYNVIQVYKPTPSTLIVYLTLEYKQGPIFARLVTYKNQDKWMITDFLFNSRPEPVLPVIFFNNK